MSKISFKRFKYAFYKLSGLDKFKFILLLGGVILIIVILAFLFVQTNITYKSYKVLNTFEIENNSFCECDNIGDDILYYSSSEVFLVSPSGEKYWQTSIEMTKPVLKKSNNFYALIDVNSNKIVTFRSDKIVGKYETSGIILSGSVCDNGVVSVIEKISDKVQINLYDSRGSLLLENKTGGDANFYPMCAKLSSDGVRLITSYYDAENKKSTIQIFDFSKKKNVDKSLVYKKTYNDLFITDIFAFEDEQFVVVGDNKVLFFKGHKTPKEIKKVEYNSEIKSIVCDSEGLVTVSNSYQGSEEYIFRKYDLNGNIDTKFSLKTGFDKITMYKKNVVFYNEYGVAIYKLNGKKVFDKEFDENILLIINKFGANKYLIVTNEGLKEVRLKN